MPKCIENDALHFSGNSAGLKRKLCKQKQKEKKNSVKLIKSEKVNVLSCTLKEIH
jgi:hypothetical protein